MSAECVVAEDDCVCAHGCVCVYMYVCVCVHVCVCVCTWLCVCAAGLPVVLRQSVRSGVAPWRRRSRGLPEDGQTSAGMCCCNHGDPGRHTDMRSRDPSSADTEREREIERERERGRERESSSSSLLLSATQNNTRLD